MAGISAHCCRGGCYRVGVFHLRLAMRVKRRSAGGWVIYRLIYPAPSEDGKNETNRFVIAAFPWLKRKESTRIYHSSLPAAPSSTHLAQTRERWLVTIEQSMATREKFILPLLLIFVTSIHWSCQSVFMIAFGFTCLLVALLCNY